MSNRQGEQQEKRKEQRKMDVENRRKRAGETERGTGRMAGVGSRERDIRAETM